MKKIIVKVVVLVFTLSILSCGKDKKEETKTTAPETEQTTTTAVVDLNKTDTKSDVVFTDDHINKVYGQYLMIKKGLVNSDAKLVQQEAKKFNEMLTDDEEKKQLKATAELISLTKEINKQRDFFVTLTEETEKLISNADITSGEVYKQFCPMAFEGNGGYWLSNSKEVRNPYYGDKMLKCGSVNQTIK